MRKNNRCSSCQCDFFQDYQNYKLTKRNLSTSSGSNNGSENCLFETTNLQVADSKIPINAHPIETKLIHLAQSAGLSLNEKRR